MTFNLHKSGPWGTKWYASFSPYFSSLGWRDLQGVCSHSQANPARGLGLWCCWNQCGPLWCLHCQASGPLAGCLNCLIPSPPHLKVLNAGWGDSQLMAHLFHPMAKEHLKHMCASTSVSRPSRPKVCFQATIDMNLVKTACTAVLLWSLCTNFFQMLFTKFGI